MQKWRIWWKKEWPFILKKKEMNLTLNLRKVIKERTFICVYMSLNVVYISLHFYPRYFPSLWTQLINLPSFIMDCSYNEHVPLTRENTTWVLRYDNVSFQFFLYAYTFPFTQLKLHVSFSVFAVKDWWRFFVFSSRCCSHSGEFACFIG